MGGGGGGTGRTLEACRESHCMMGSQCNPRATRKRLTDRAYPHTNLFLARTDEALAIRIESGRSVVSRMQIAMFVLTGMVFSQG